MEFLIGARRPHEGEMLRLGLRQLEEGERRLKGLLAAYQETKTPSLAQQIVQECIVISQTLDATEELVTSGTKGGNLIIAGGLRKVSRHLGKLLEEAQRTIRAPEQ